MADESKYNNPDDKEIMDNFVDGFEKFHMLYCALVRAGFEPSEAQSIIANMIVKTLWGTIKG